MQFVSSITDGAVELLVLYSTVVDDSLSGLLSGQVNFRAGRI